MEITRFATIKMKIIYFVFLVQFFVFIVVNETI